MNLRHHRLCWLLAIATLTVLAQDAWAGGPYGGDKYLPQRRFHGYYPTIWRPWASGWQAPIHKDNLPKVPQTPTVAPEPLPAPSEDAPPSPPPSDSLPLEPLTPSTPAPSADEPPPLPTPPGLEGSLPEPSTPGTPATPPGLEEMPQDPTAPGATPIEPMTEPAPGLPDSPLEPPSGLDEPGLTPPNLDEMPDPSLPPGFDMPDLDDEAAPESSPEDESTSEPGTPDRSGMLPSTKWRGASSLNTPGGSAAQSRLRITKTPQSVPAEDAATGEPRRLSLNTPQARPLPQRLPVPIVNSGSEAMQVRFNTAAVSPSVENPQHRRDETQVEDGSSQPRNPLRAQQEPARRVVRLSNPLR